MKALRDIYKLEVDEPFKQLFTQGMITHKTYRTQDKRSPPGWSPFYRRSIQ